MLMILEINLLESKLIVCDDFMQDMLDISKWKFVELVIDDNNYLTWAVDAKVNLEVQGLISP